jgi:hypothetical protein
MSKNTKIHNTFLDDQQEKQYLQRIILGKEKMLIELVEQNEHFKEDLFIVKQEYDIKIGRPYLKLNETDLEILKLKKIEELISKGFRYEEALKVIDSTLGNKREQIGEEYKKLDVQEKDIQKVKAVSQTDQEELKKYFVNSLTNFIPT